MTARGENEDAYGVDRLNLLGEGQTIVLVDSYGEPTGAADLKAFHDTFFPGLRAPNFTAVYPNGSPDFKNVGNGQSGSSGAEGWAAVKLRSTSSGPTRSRRSPISS